MEITLNECIRKVDQAEAILKALNRSVYKVEELYEDGFSASHTDEVDTATIFVKILKDIDRLEITPENVNDIVNHITLSR